MDLEQKTFFRIFVNVKYWCGPWWWSSGQRAHLLSDDTSSNPAEAYSFSVKLCLKGTKMNIKEAGVGPL